MSNENKVVLPEPDAVISELMGLVDEWGMESHLRGEAELDAQHSEATQEEIDCAKDRASKERAAWKAIESKLRALLATATGLPAQAVDADSLKLLADIRSMAESTIKAGLVDDRELLHTFETIVMTAAKAKRPICAICDSKGFIAFDDEQARGRNGGKWGVCKACTTAAPQAQADARDAVTFEQRMSDWQHGDALDAERYRWLRSRDLETISQGGVFAGMTPQNVILNEEDLDQAVDAAIAAAKEK